MSDFADTPNSGSVSSITTALPSDTSLTLPTRPAPLTTGWSTRTPSLEPLLIWKVWYQELGERAITRADDRLVVAEAAGGVHLLEAP